MLRAFVIPDDLARRAAGFQGRLPYDRDRPLDSAPMPRLRIDPRTALLVAAACVAIVAVGVIVLSRAPALIAGRLRSVAARRDLQASWRTIRVRWPVETEITDLRLVNANGDTAAVADRVEIGVNPWSILVLAPSRRRIRNEHATIAMHSL